MLKTLEKDDPLVGGEIAGRFGVDSILGQGGMGTVYAGRQLSVGRPVAIKVLRSILANDDIIVQRFFREAKVISQFNHPNIVNLIDFGHDVDKGILYLVMEFIDGIELGDLLTQGRLSPEIVLDLMIQVCEGLSEPHSQGIIHRDLKPENIMLVPRSDGRIQAKVVDFGIAHALQGGDETRLTQTGSVFGTVHYMAPEQACGEPVGPFTDVYALGCILFELLVGATPFKGDTAVRLLMAHTVEPPPVLDQVLPPSDLIRDLSALNTEMLRKSGSERPASVLEVRDRLETIRLNHRISPARVDTSLPKDKMFSAFLAESVEVRRGKDSGTGLLQAQTDIQKVLRNTGAELNDQAPIAAEQQQQRAVNLATRFNIDEDELDDDEPSAKSPILPIAIAIGGLLIILLLGAGAALFFISKSGDATSPEDQALIAAAQPTEPDEQAPEDDTPPTPDEAIEESADKKDEEPTEDADALANTDEQAPDEQKEQEKEEPAEIAGDKKSEEKTKEAPAPPKKAAKPAPTRPSRPAQPARPTTPPPAPQEPAAEVKAPPPAQQQQNTQKQQQDEKKPTLNIFGLD